MKSYNRYPLGLLGLLDAKVRGQTPNELSEFTQATLELAPFLLEQGAEVIVDDTAAVVGANGQHFGTLLTVPQDELWYIHAFNVRPSVNLAAGTTYRFAALHKTTLATGAAAVGQFVRGDTVSAIAGERPFAGGASYEPFLAAPGDQLGLWCAQITLGTSQVFQIHAKLSRLRV